MIEHLENEEYNVLSTLLSDIIQSGRGILRYNIMTHPALARFADELAPPPIAPGDGSRQWEWDQYFKIAEVWEEAMTEVIEQALRETMKLWLEAWSS